ncbi:hypothetical protein I3843_02G140200 [Carya illinoinensis]|nr:hypothetical protein I3843_02G140200 [Carya illinoinensis]
MPSRPLAPTPSPPGSTFFTQTGVLFLILTISGPVVILLSIIYFLFHAWHFLIVRRTKTIPFDSSAPLKLQRFSYRELKQATNGFDTANIIGKGGSGIVFRGTLGDGKLIAIKRLDVLSSQTEREFQNELQILGGLRSSFLVTLLGYCAEKNRRVLVYEYIPNNSLQEALFGDGSLSLSWERRFDIIIDVAKAIEFLHLGCDPPVIHGDIKPSNILLDSEYRARISDFGLSRVKLEGESGVDLFSQDLGKSQELWKSQELSGNLAAETPAIGTPVESAPEVDFALALQASTSSKNGRISYNVRALNINSSTYNANMESEKNGKTSSVKGKELSAVIDNGGDDWSNRFMPYDDEFSSIDHSKELSFNASSAVVEDVDTKQWGKNWWWNQDRSGESCSKDYVMEWIGSQICPSTNPDWVEEKKSPERNNLDNSTPLDKLEDLNEPQSEEVGCENLDKGFEKKGSRGKTNRRKEQRKMQEWWREEHLAEIIRKGSKFKKFETKWRITGFKMPHYGLGRGFRFRRGKNFGEQSQNQGDILSGEFSFRRGCKKKSTQSIGSDNMWSGDLFSRELSSTTSMRGTLCYVAPEYGGCEYLIEKGDIYSLGVLILVIVSGRRPLHILASPMKIEKANLISWCRQLAQSGNVLELVDERLKDDYNKDQATLCINLALACLQKYPELRPDIGEIVKILKGEMDLPPLPPEFSPSPASRLSRRSRRNKKANAD